MTKAGKQLKSVSAHAGGASGPARIDISHLQACSQSQQQQQQQQDGLQAQPELEQLGQQLHPACRDTEQAETQRQQAIAEVTGQPEQLASETHMHAAPHDPDVLSQHGFGSGGAAETDADVSSSLLMGISRSPSQAAQAGVGAVPSSARPAPVTIDAAAASKPRHEELSRISAQPGAPEAPACHVPLPYSLGSCQQVDSATLEGDRPRTSTASASDRSAPNAALGFAAQLAAFLVRGAASGPERSDAMLSQPPGLAVHQQQAHVLEQDIIARSSTDGMPSGQQVELLEAGANATQPLVPPVAAPAPQNQSEKQIEREDVIVYDR